MVGIDDGAGGFFAQDLGFGRGVETCAEVSAVMIDDGSVCGGAEAAFRGVKGGWLTCRCS